MSLRNDYDQIILVPRNTWFSQIPGLEWIPSNSIVYKTVTGIGATYSEVLANRNSIIVLPHVSIIKNKQLKYKDKHHTFAVHGDSQQSKIKDIINYLKSDLPYKKFLTTPKGLEKIKKAFMEQEETLDRLYRDYFLLIDECHKWVKDTGYREDMLPTMNDFFEFKDKAMVSATILPLRDSRFKQHQFTHIKLEPSYSYKKDLKLYQVNSITTGLKEYIVTTQAQTYCIFFNSIKGIKSLIADLELINDSRIFCSAESKTLLNIDSANEKVEYNVSSEFKPEDGAKLKRYNFFTSSFYTGLDIDLTIKPNIIILTDGHHAEFSIVDPYTDVPQIIGRFRNDMYNEVVHINNSVSFTKFLDIETLEKKIESSKIVCNLIDEVRKLAIDNETNQIFTELMLRISPYATFLDDNQIYSPYKEDNYRDINRIKSYYNQQCRLLAAYRASGLFLVSVEKTSFEKKQLIYLKNSPGKYSIENVKMVAEALDEMEQIKGTITHLVFEHTLGQLFPLVISAYQRLGFLELTDLKFRISGIKRSVMLLDLIEKVKRIPVDLIYNTFKKGRAYTRSFIKRELQRIYDDLDLDLTATATDILKYFDVRYKNLAVHGKSNNSLFLIDYKYAMSKDYGRK